MLIFYLIKVINNSKNGIPNTPIDGKKLSKKIKGRMIELINATRQRKREKNG
jgi:hypothetical protein